MPKTKTHLPEQEAALATYRLLVEENEQAIPILMMGAGGSVSLVDLTDLDGDVRTSLRMLYALKDSGSLPHPEWVMLSTEVYRSEANTLAEADQLKHGELAELHKLGKPNVHEAMMIIFVHYDGPYWAVTQDFKRQDGHVEWDEVCTMESPQGVIDELLKSLVSVP